MNRQRTEDERRGEVARWRASGQSAGAFASSRGYSRASLMTWAKTSGQSSRLATPKLVRLEVVAANKDLWVEVGKARIHVTTGFNAALLRELVNALSVGSTQ